jgi:hypothetical protein
VRHHSPQIQLDSGNWDDKIGGPLVGLPTKDKMMANMFRRPLSLALGALATTTLGGCYYGDVYGSSYASSGACASDYGDYDPYSYDDGYGYGCYDSGDYGAGFAQIGFGGGWYDDYYYPGYGLWMFDNYHNRYPLRGQYLNYWGGRRAWWRHHGGRGDGDHHGGRPGRPGGANGHDGGNGHHGGRPGRPGGWNGHDRDNDHHDGRPGRPGGWSGHEGNGRPHGTRPGTRPGNGHNPPPAATRPGRPDRGPIARPDGKKPQIRSVLTGRPAREAAEPRRPSIRQPTARPPIRSAPAARPAPQRAERPAPAPRPNRSDRIRAQRDQ